MVRRVLTMLALSAALCLSANAQTRVLSIGWEGTYMYNDGENYGVQVTRNILITGYNITYTLYPWHNLSAAVLCTINAGSVYHVNPTSEHFVICDSPGGSDWVNSQPLPFEGNINHGGLGSGGGEILRTILKSKGEAVIKDFQAQNLAIEVPAWGWIVSHMNVSGDDSMDCEVQGVIYYQYQ